MASIFRSPIAICSAVAVLLLLAASSSSPAGAEPAVDDEGFTVLFGNDPPVGWIQAGPGGFDIKDGVATPRGGMGLWYYGQKKFRNFILKLDFKQAEIRSNSGVYVRFPRVDGDPWIPVREGYEIQIAGDKPSKGSTGAVYDFQAADSIPLKPAGQWNEYEIAAVGQQYTIRLNGLRINTYTGSRALEGMIGLQNHNDHDIVEFRNIRVKELPDDATAYHVLFDGSDTSAWKMAGPGSFELKDGALNSHGGMGLYWHPQVLGDFVLMLDWKATHKEDNSGVFVRFPDPGNDPWVAVKQGYEMQICDPAPAKHRTGSVYSFQDSTDVPTKPVGEWNHYEIRAVGQKYEVWINGKQVNDYTGDRGLDGRVGLQNHDEKSAVTFRNVRVVSLGKAK